MDFTKKQYGFFYFNNIGIIILYPFGYNIK